MIEQILVWEKEEERLREAGNVKYNVANHEYNDAESIDSFDSDFKNTDLGILEIEAHKLNGSYLPDLRHKHERSIVPVEPIMRIAAAPAERLESIASNLE